MVPLTLVPTTALTERPDRARDDRGDRLPHHRADDYRDRQGWTLAALVGIGEGIATRIPI